MRKEYENFCILDDMDNMEGDFYLSEKILDSLNTLSEKLQEHIELFCVLEDNYKDDTLFNG